MGTENTDKTPIENKGGADGINRQPPPEPKSEPKADAKAEPKPEPKPEPKAAADAKDKKPEPKADEGPRKVTLKADDEIPEDADLVELSPRQFRSRMARHTKSELKERFGTDDVDEIKKKLDRVDALEKAEEERKQAAMTELEREKTARLAAEEKANKAEARANAMYAQRDFERIDTRMSKIAEKYIDPDYVDDQLPKLAAYIVENFTEEEAKNLKDGQIEKFFKELIEKKPKLGKDYDPEAVVAAKKKVAANNSPKDNEKPGERREGDQSPQNGKTFKPGQQNTMTKAEARAEMARQFGGRSPY